MRKRRAFRLVVGQLRQPHDPPFEYESVEVYQVWGNGLAFVAHGEPRRRRWFMLFEKPTDGEAMETLKLRLKSPHREYAHVDRYVLLKVIKRYNRQFIRDIDMESVT